MSSASVSIFENTGKNASHGQTRRETLLPAAVISQIPELSELREGLWKMINGVLDVSDAVIFNHGLNGKDLLECSREELLIEHDCLREKLFSIVEAMKGRQLIEKLESIEVVIQTHNKVMAEQSATIMEQNAQINEHRRRVRALEDSLRLSKKEKAHEQNPSTWRPMSPLQKNESHDKDSQLQDVREQLAVACRLRDEALRLRDKHIQQSENLCSKLAEIVKEHEQLRSEQLQLQSLHLQLQGELRAVTMERDEYLQQLTRRRNELTMELDISRGYAKELLAERDALRQQMDLMGEHNCSLVKSLEGARTGLTESNQDNMEKEKHIKELESYKTQLADARNQLVQVSKLRDQYLQQLKMKEADEELQAERLKRDEAELTHVTEQLHFFQVQALPRLQQEQVDLHAELKRVKEQLESVTQLKGVKGQLETFSDDLCAAGRASNESELALIAEQLQSLPDLTQKAAVLQEELKRAREQLQIKQEKKDHEAELNRVCKEQVEVLTFLQQANSELQRKLNLAQEQLTTAQNRVSELQMELKLKHVKEQLEILSNDPRVAGSASKESELAYIKEQLQSLPDLAQEAAELQEGLKRTREQLQIIPELRQEKKDLEAELTRVRKEQLEALTFLEQANSELQRKLNLAEEQLTTAQNRVSELQTELNIAKEQIQIIPDLQQEKEELSSEFSRLKDQFQSLSFLQQANSEFQRHLILAQDLLATAHKRVSELQMELNNAQDLFATAHKRVSELQMELNVAEKQLQIIPDLQQEKEDLQSKLNEVKEQVDALLSVQEQFQALPSLNPHLLRLQQANSELQRKLNLAHEQLTTALKRDYELQMELKVQPEVQLELQSLTKKEHFVCQDDNVLALKHKQCCAVRSAAPLRLSAASLQDQENQSEETFSTPPSSPPLGVSETFTTDSSSVGELTTDSSSVGERLTPHLSGTAARISYNMQEQRTTAQKRESGLQKELNLSKEQFQIIPDLKQAVFPGPVVYI